ncbi:MAG: MOSC domain-containing protein [Calditrichia bacterium]
MIRIFVYFKNAQFNNECFSYKSDLFVKAAVLDQIILYPLKSARGIPLSRSEVEIRGLKFDRRWMLVDSNGQFLSQRRFPRLALIDVEIEPDELIFSAPHFGRISLPLETISSQRISVQIWTDVCQGIPVSPEADSWFSKFLKIPCRLVYFPENSNRPIDPGYSINSYSLSFADGFPFLLISWASLDDLNHRLESPLPMDRFRPNLVVEGCPPYAEDSWDKIRIGSVDFRVVKPCSRCVITTIDQATAKGGVEPLKTLAQYRKQNGKILFGQNLIHENLGSIQIGDRVEII